MARQKAISKAKDQIVELFRQRKGSSVFTTAELRNFFHEVQQHLDLPQSLSFKAFCENFIQEGLLEKIDLKFPWRNFPRFVWGKDASDLKIISTISNDGYFSHFTAAKIHGLTLQNPKEIYFNVEQADRPQGQGLAQESIDRAFKNRPRTTSQETKFKNSRVFYLMGKQTRNLGVIESDGIKVTDIERTLIDIVVRPIYSGGIREVTHIYREAINSGLEVSVNRLRSYLQKLNYIYPYQQAIGFLLEQAGASSPIIELLHSDVSKYDFYLDYKILNPVYNKKWRLFIPNDLAKAE